MTINHFGLYHCRQPCLRSLACLSPAKGSDSIDNIIKRFKNYPSIKSIKVKFNSVHSFSFQLIFLNEVKTVNGDMKNNKSVDSDIPIQILKESEFTFEILFNCMKKSIETGCFPDSVKEANITLIFEKDDPLDKSNNRSVSILPLISRVCEKLIYNQLSEYTESFSSHILRNFRNAVHNMHFSKLP